MEFVTLAQLLPAIFVFIMFLIYRDVKKPLGFPPGPTWFPLVGCLPQFRSSLSRLVHPHLVWSELASRYGPLVGLRLGRERGVLVSGYHAVKHVLSRADCDGRPRGFVFKMRTFGQNLGVVMTDGSMWHDQRSFALRQLRNLGLGRDRLEQIILEETEALVKLLKQRCDATKGTEISLHNLCDISVINNLWALVAGKRFDLTDARLVRLFNASRSFTGNIDMSGGLLNQIPAVRFLAPGRTGYNAMMNGINVLHEFLNDSIKEHKKTLSSGEPRDLIDAFLIEMSVKKDNPAFTEKQLLSMCLDLFMAGLETSSNTLAFLLLHLLRQPEVQRRAQSDIDAVVGRERSPTLADRPRLPYIDAVIMEVMRREFMVPITVPHRTTQNCEIMGYKIPKDTMVLLSLHSILMDPEYWEDPETFRPERFLDHTGENLIKEERLIPFGLGKRRCLGESLARSTLFLFLTALLQNFSFELSPGHQVLPHLDGMTLAPRPFTGIVTLR